MISNQLWTRCLTIARNLSPTSPELRTSHIVFLIKDRVIQHIGINKVKTHPIILKHPYHAGKVYLHAEVDAILKSRKEYLGDYQLISISLNYTICIMHAHFIKSLDDFRLRGVRIL